MEAINYQEIFLKFQSEEETLQLFYRLFENSIEGLVISDAQNNILLVNPSFTRITGYSLAEAVGTSPNILKSGMHPESFYHKMWGDLQNDGIWQGEIWNKRKNGTIYPEFLKIITILDNNAIKFYVAIINDMTYLKDFEKNMQSELKFARNVQLKILPQDPSPNDSYVLESIYMPMEQIGGDYYDYIEQEDEDELGIFISDVSGHGIPSALIASMVKSYISSFAEKFSQPGEFLKFLNQKLVNQIEPYFLTAFYAIVNFKTKRLRYSRSGHPYPIILRKNQLFYLDGKGSSMLGVFDDSVFPEFEIQLYSGDKILFYTDGLTESMNMEGKYFDDELETVLKQNQPMNIHDLVEEITYRLLMFHGKSTYDDDICLVGLEIL